MSCTKDLYDFMELGYNESSSCPCLRYLLHKGAVEISMPGATGTLSFLLIPFTAEEFSALPSSFPRPAYLQHRGGRYSILLLVLQLFFLSLGGRQWDLLWVMAWYWVISGAKYCGNVLSSCKSKVSIQISLEYVGPSLVFELHQLCSDYVI